MPAVEFRAVGEGFELFEHSSIRSAGDAGEYRIIRTCFFRAKLLQELYQLLRNRDLPLFPILWMESPMWFCRDADGHVLEIHIAPGNKPAFRIPKSGHEIELEPDLLGKFSGFE